jgi:hypothetical protein
LRCNNREEFTLQNLEELPVAHVVARSGVVLSVVFAWSGAESLTP